MQNQLRLLCLMSMFGLLISCDNKARYQDLQTYIEQLKQVVATPKKDAPTVLNIPKPATFKTITTQSPFEDKESSSAASKKAQLGTPLEAYPVSMLRFVGTATIDNVTYAYILAPDNLMYQVKEGDPIGDHYGKVLNLQADKLNVIEEDSESGITGKQHVVTMQLKEEANAPT